MATDTVTIEHFIEAQRISMTAVRTDSNPNMPDSRNMDHWKVTLVRRDAPRVRGSWEYQGKILAKMTLTFSQGYGHNGEEPELGDVLDCLSSDAAGLANAQDFEEWCSEFGYDPDSRKAYKTYTAVEHQASRLQTFLGDDAYDALLWHTERR
jgi:hypothetical protein